MPRKKNAAVGSEGITAVSPAAPEVKTVKRKAAVAPSAAVKASGQKAPRKRAAQPVVKTANEVPVELDLANYHDEVARLAYHLWEARGRVHGNPDEDWFRAQEEFRRRVQPVNG